MVRGGGTALDFVQTYGRRTLVVRAIGALHSFVPRRAPGCGYWNTYVCAWHPAVCIPSGTLSAPNLVGAVRRWVFPPGYRLGSALVARV